MGRVIDSGRLVKSSYMIGYWIGKGRLEEMSYDRRQLVWQDLEETAEMVRSFRMVRSTWSTTFVSVGWFENMTVLLANRSCVTIIGTYFDHSVWLPGLGRHRIDGRHYVVHGNPVWKTWTEKNGNFMALCPQFTCFVSFSLTRFLQLNAMIKSYDPV